MVKSKSAKDRMLRGPHMINGHQWWYEDKGGIRVVAQFYLGSTHVRITWAKLLKAAKRCGR